MESVPSCSILTVTVTFPEFSSTRFTPSGRYCVISTVSSIGAEAPLISTADAGTSISLILSMSSLFPQTWTLSGVLMHPVYLYPSAGEPVTSNTTGIPLTFSTSTETESPFSPRLFPICVWFSSLPFASYKTSDAGSTESSETPLTSSTCATARSTCFKTDSAPVMVT